MSQKFHVLRCYKCRTFQSHIVKKSNKWDCKVCGDKQSLQRTFGNGTGKECRLHVQNLNIRLMHAEQGDFEDMSSAHTDTVAFSKSSPESSPTVHQFDDSTSKWTKYLMKPPVVNDDSELVYEALPERRNLNIKKINYLIQKDNCLPNQNPAFNDVEKIIFDNHTKWTNRFNVNDDLCEVPRPSVNKRRSVTERMDPAISKLTKYITMPPVENDELQFDNSESAADSIGKQSPKKRNLNIKKRRHHIDLEENTGNFQYEEFRENLSSDSQCKMTRRFNVNNSLCDVSQISDSRQSVVDRIYPATSKWTKYLVETIPSNQNASPAASECPKHSVQIFDSFMNDKLFTLEDVLHV